MALVIALGCAPPAGDDGGSSESDSDPAQDGGDAASADGTTAEGPARCDGASDGFELDGGEESVGGEESSGGGEDETAGMGDDIPIGASVLTMRTGGIEAGTLVELEPAIVTAPAARMPDGASLVYVQMAGSGPDRGMPLRITARVVAEALRPGDVVQVVGRTATKAGFAWLLVDDDVERIGTAEIPSAVDVPIDDLAGGSVAEGYESMLVRVEHVEVEQPEVCDGEIELVGGLRVDDLFLGDAAPAADKGATWSAIVGPLVYEDDAFEVAPRSLADLEP